jgi:hypothetical protein
MVRVSKRQKMLRFLRSRWKYFLYMNGDDEDSDADNMLEMGAALMASRYLSARPVAMMKLCTQATCWMQLCVSCFLFETE